MFMEKLCTLHGERMYFPQFSVLLVFSTQCEILDCFLGRMIACYSSMQQMSCYSMGDNSYRSGPHIIKRMKSTIVLMKYFYIYMHGCRREPRGRCSRYTLF